VIFAPKYTKLPASSISSPFMVFYYIGLPVISMDNIMLFTDAAILTCLVHLDIIILSVQAPSLIAPYDE